jgi:hypothetical protein
MKKATYEVATLKNIKSHIYDVITVLTEGE